MGALEPKMGKGIVIGKDVHFVGNVTVWNYVVIGDGTVIGSFYARYRQKRGHRQELAFRHTQRFPTATRSVMTFSSLPTA